MQSDRDKAIKSNPNPLRIAPYGYRDIGGQTYSMLCLGIKDRATIRECTLRMKRTMKGKTE